MSVPARMVGTPVPEIPPSTEQISKLTYVCYHLSNSDRSLRSICADDAVSVSPQTILRWCGDHRSLAEQYARAKDDQVELLAEQILEIADDSSRDMRIVVRDGIPMEVVDHEHINRSRLRVDTRKWIASKLKPKKYGEKLELEANVRMLFGID